MSCLLLGWTCVNQNRIEDTGHVWVWAAAGENCPAAANINDLLLIGSPAISEAAMPRSCSAASPCHRAGKGWHFCAAGPRFPQIFVYSCLWSCSGDTKYNQTITKTAEWQTNPWICVPHEAGRQKWRGMHANHKSCAAIVQIDRVSHQNETGLWKPLCSKSWGLNPLLFWYWVLSINLTELPGQVIKSPCHFLIIYKIGLTVSAPALYKGDQGLYGTTNNSQILPENCMPTFPSYLETSNLPSVSLKEDLFQHIIL